MVKQVTYVLKFYRHRGILDIEIHPDWDSAAMAAVSYISCYCTTRSATEFENLIQSWDSELGPMTWSDGEYEILLDSQEARHAAREDNVCRIIPLRRASA